MKLPRGLCPPAREELSDNRHDYEEQAESISVLLAVLMFLFFLWGIS